MLSGDGHDQVLHNYVRNAWLPGAMPRPTALQAESKAIPEQVESGQAGDSRTNTPKELYSPAQGWPRSGLPWDCARAKCEPCMGFHSVPQILRRRCGVRIVQPFQGWWRIFPKTQGRPLRGRPWAGECNAFGVETRTEPIVYSSQHAGAVRRFSLTFCGGWTTTCRAPQLLRA
jgi:hypothetical protein